MLRRKLNTNRAQVYGIVQSVVNCHMTVKFDHINEPYEVERFRGRFTLMKSCNIYRRQFL